MRVEPGARRSPGAVWGWLIGMSAHKRGQFDPKLVSARRSAPGAPPLATRCIARDHCPGFDTGTPDAPRAGKNERPNLGNAGTIAPRKPHPPTIPRRQLTPRQHAREAKAL